MQGDRACAFALRFTPSMISARPKKFAGSPEEENRFLPGGGYLKNFNHTGFKIVTTISGILLKKDNVFLLKYSAARNREEFFPLPFQILEKVFFTYVPVRIHILSLP